MSATAFQRMRREQAAKRQAQIAKAAEQKKAESKPETPAKEVKKVDDSGSKGPTKDKK